MHWWNPTFAAQNAARLGTQFSFQIEDFRLKIADLKSAKNLATRHKLQSKTCDLHSSFTILL
jgi:hypothetical protein